MIKQENEMNRGKISFTKILVGVMLFVLLLLHSLAQAATITVTSSADSGAGTLRQAIVDAASDDTINFGSSAESVINCRLR
jgi:hypothetical protein